MMQQLETINYIQEVQRAKMDKPEKQYSVKMVRNRNLQTCKLNIHMPLYYTFYKIVMVMVSLQLIKFYLAGIVKMNGTTIGVPHQLYFRRDSIKPRCPITLSF